VYKFLDRLTQKGVIEFDDNIKPVSREYIAQKLASTKLSKLSNLENEVFEFYLKEYQVEMMKYGKFPPEADQPSAEEIMNDEL